MWSAWQGDLLGIPIAAPLPRAQLALEHYMLAADAMGGSLEVRGRLLRELLVESRAFGEWGWGLVSFLGVCEETWVEPRHVWIQGPREKAARPARAQHGPPATPGLPAREPYGGCRACAHATTPVSSS